MPELGERKTAVCKATGRPVEMVYTGAKGDDGSINGHPGWLCLHPDAEEEADRESEEREKEEYYARDG